MATNTSDIPSSAGGNKEDLARLKATLFKDWSPHFAEPLMELAEWQTIIGAWKVTRDQAAGTGASGVSPGAGKEASVVWQQTESSVIDAEDEDPLKDFKELLSHHRVRAVRLSEVPSAALPDRTPSRTPSDAKVPQSIWLDGISHISPGVQASFSKIDQLTGVQTSKRSFVSSRTTMPGYTRHVLTMIEERGMHLTSNKRLKIVWVSVLDHYQYSYPENYLSWSAYQLNVNRVPITMAFITMAVNSEGNQEMDEDLPTLRAPWQILADVPLAASETLE